MTNMLKVQPTFIMSGFVAQGSSYLLHPAVFQFEMDKESHISDQPPQDPSEMHHRLFPSIRLFMVFLAFCGLTALKCGFAAFNFGIVCMVRSLDDNGTWTGGHSGIFTWDNAERANLLAAYSWGSVVMSIPSGWLCDKYGGRYVFLLALLVATISTAITPWAAFRGESWLFAARVFTGMTGGAGWPAVVQMATRWGRPHERPFLIAFGTSGALFGQLITSPIAGIMCQTEAGWPSVFYMSAGYQLLMAIIWTCLYTDDPEQCRFISEEECVYLTQEDENDLDLVQEKPQTPWRHVLFSPASLAIYLCHFCNLWVTIFSNVFVPTYGKEVLDLDITSNGFYSALPLLTEVIASVLFGAMAQKISCKSRSTTFSVKFFNTLCMGIPCFGLLALTFLDRASGVGAAIFCLCLCTFFLATSTASFIRCMVLIAPKFSGTISSVSSMYSYAACIIMPYVVGAVTTDGSIYGWHLAFYIGLGLALFGWLEFMIFGSGEEQKWAKQANETPGDVEKADTVSHLKF